MSSRWFARMFCIVGSALAIAGMAGVASAQGPVCISLNHGVPPLDVLRLVVTFPATGFASIVGERIPKPTDFGVRGVLSGSGLVTSVAFEISLHETGLGAIPLPAGLTPFLFTNALHIRLDNVTLIGPFKAYQTEILSTGNTATEHIEGTATLVPCPPGG